MVISSGFSGPKNGKSSHPAKSSVAANTAKTLLAAAKSRLFFIIV
jgi:hypothetical protein